MKTVCWDRPDFTLSKIGFGCAPVMGRVGKRQSMSSMEKAFDLGVTHFDIARSYGYGEAEKILGKFVSGKRDRVTIATKFGIVPAYANGLFRLVKPLARTLVERVPAVRTAIRKHSAGMLPRGFYSFRSAKRSLDESLKQLKVDYLDILFIHDCCPDDELSGQLSEFLDELILAGKLRAWGIATRIEWIESTFHKLSTKPQVIQYRNNIFNRQRLLGPKLAAIPRIYHSPFDGRTADLVTCMLPSSTHINRWAKLNNVNMQDNEVINRLIFESGLFLSNDSIILCSMFNPKHIQANIEAVESPMFMPKQLQEFLDLVRGSCSHK